MYDGASNGQLDDEFGTHKEEEVVTQILEKGNLQNHEVSDRLVSCSCILV